MMSENHKRVSDTLLEAMQTEVDTMLVNAKKMVDRLDAVSDRIARVMDDWPMVHTAELELQAIKDEIDSISSRKQRETGEVKIPT